MSKDSMNILRDVEKAAYKIAETIHGTDLPDEMKTNLAAFVFFEMGQIAGTVMNSIEKKQKDIADE